MKQTLAAAVSREQSALWKLVVLEQAPVYSARMTNGLHDTCILGDQI